MQMGYSNYRNRTWWRNNQLCCTYNVRESQSNRDTRWKSLLNKYESGLRSKCVCNYGAAVVMLIYLQGSTQPEISMAVHQYARFFNNPRLVHERAVKSISKYPARKSTYLDLLDVKQQLTTQGIVYRPNIEKGIKCYVYSKFVGGWAQADADNA